MLSTGTIFTGTPQPGTPTPGTEITTIMPYLDCIYSLGDGTYLAYFGYENLSSERIVIPEGTSSGMTNQFNPSIESDSYINEFFPGRQKAVFAVPFTGSTIQWQLSYPGQTARSVNANIYSVLCERIIPIKECIKVGETSKEAVFGYFNPNPFPILAPVGYGNSFSPAPVDRAQPVEFFAGRINNVFSVPFNGSSQVAWTLGNLVSFAGDADAACLTEATPQPQGAAAEVPGTEAPRTEMGCSETSTAELLIEANSFMTEMLKLVLKSGDENAAMKASEIFENSKNEMHKWPKEVVNCQDLEVCSREDLYKRNEMLITHTNHLYRVVANALKKAQDNSVKSRRKIREARMLNKMVLEVLGEAPRFRSSCN